MFQFFALRGVFERPAEKSLSTDRGARKKSARFSINAFIGSVNNLSLGWSHASPGAPTGAPGEVRAEKVAVDQLPKPEVSPSSAPREPVPPPVIGGSREGLLPVTTTLTSPDVASLHCW